MSSRKDQPEVCRLMYATKHHPVSWGRALCLVCFTALPLFAQKVPVVEKTLSNGMRVLLVEREDETTVSGGWVAHVGSSNERPGITGIAHLFEHMMFKGTHVIGTRDYALDARLIDEQEAVMEEMRAAYRRGEIDDITKPEAKTPRMKQLEAQFDSLVAKQRANMIKNEFDLVL